MAAPMTEQEKAYQRAAEVADRLLGEGLPVVKFGDTDGGRCGVVVLEQDGDRRGYGFPADMPMDQAAEVVRGGWSAFLLMRERSQ